MYVRSALVARGSSPDTASPHVWGSNPHPGLASIIPVYDTGVDLFTPSALCLRAARYNTIPTPSSPQTNNYS